MRRFEIAPLLVAAGAVTLLVSLFLDWYGDQTAWAVFELTDVLLAALALAALVAAAGHIAPDVAYFDRGWLPAAVVAAAILVAAQLLSPPPAAGGADPQTGAWIGFAASLAMLVGAVLTVGRVSLSVAIEGREPRQRVAAVDHRPPTTETGTVVPRTAEPPTAPTVPESPAPASAEPSTRTTRRRQKEDSGPTNAESSTGPSRRGGRKT